VIKVLENIQAFLEQKKIHSSWHFFLMERFKKTEAMVEQGYWIPCLELPDLLSSSLNLAPQDIRLLTMTSSFIYLGADLLDDLQDAELELSSYNISPSEVTLISATLLTVFPILALADLETDTDTKFKMQKTLAHSLLVMSAGQQQDLALSHKNSVSVEIIKKSIECKSGEELALSCSLAAQLAKLSLSQQKSYENFGRTLGTAIQIVSDFHELIWSKTSSDLKQGTRSLPIAFCLEKFQGDDRKKLIELLQTPHWGSQEKTCLKNILTDAGALAYTTLVVENLCQQSLEILNSLTLTQEMEVFLKEKILSASLLGTTFNNLTGENYHGVQQPKLFGA